MMKIIDGGVTAAERISGSRTGSRELKKEIQKIWHWYTARNRV